ncbi:MAG TPA: cytochrome o ubiquinol oxidase subunit IV, partial [Achromobacter sp.]|nr:cytochrome o ubiquinol oxidase subunit IV [Achromobacter sp.]
MSSHMDNLADRGHGDHGHHGHGGGHDHDDDDGAGHGTLKSYFTGFVLAAIL